MGREHARQEFILSNLGLLGNQNLGERHTRVQSNSVHRGFEITIQMLGGYTEREAHMETQGGQRGKANWLRVCGNAAGLHTD